MRIFVDMDGTLAKWNNVEFEELFEEGYYRNLEPNMKILNEVNHLIRQGEDVYILSAYLTESDYAKKEKHEWINQYLPELPEEKQIFVPYGTNKAEYLKEHYSPITNTDYLIDDYTKNLLEWKEFGGIGVKYLNGINHSRGTWKGLMINEEPNGIVEIQDKSLYGLILSEKLKDYGIDLIASALSNQNQYNNFRDYRACQVHYENKSHYFQYNIDRNNKDLAKDIKTIVDITKHETIKEHQIFDVDRETLLIDVSSDYYSRHYPTIYKCDDFDVLCKELPSTILDDIEYTIYLYDETYKLPQYCETGENVERINGKYIKWYEGFITTKDFLDDIQIEANNELDNDETEIDVDM